MATTTELVVADANVFLALILPEKPERRQYAEAVFRLAERGRVRLVIPQVCRLEVTAVLMRKARDDKEKWLTLDLVQDFLERFDGMSLDLVVESYTALDLCNDARRLNCQVADVIYLQLARGLNATVASLDGGMLKACTVLQLRQFEMPAAKA